MAFDLLTFQRTSFTSSHVQPLHCAACKNLYAAHQIEKILKAELTQQKRVDTAENAQILSIFEP